MAVTKEVSSTEKAYSQALTEMAKVKIVINERGGDVARGAKLKHEQLEKNVSKLAVSDDYKRADAFLNRPARDALMKHPELDGAYKAVVTAERAAAALPPAERSARIANVRLEVFDGLRNGNLPREGVSINESANIISRSGSVRGLHVVDPQAIREPNAKGVVIAESSHHVLVQVAEGTAVRQERAVLEGHAKSGDVINIKPNLNQYAPPTLDALQGKTFDKKAALEVNSNPPGRESQVIVRDARRPEPAFIQPQREAPATRDANVITPARVEPSKQPELAARTGGAKSIPVPTRDTNRIAPKVVEKDRGGRGLER